jgi:hypothetical protein
MGFDASAIGNHEFDAGTNTFGRLIETDIRGDGNIFGRPGYFWKGAGSKLEHLVLIPTTSRRARTNPGTTRCQWQYDRSDCGKRLLSG